MTYAYPKFTLTRRAKQEQDGIVAALRMDRSLPA
jgi:hypothetical protein